MLVVAIPGCSSGRVPPAGFPRLYSCIIKITQEGEPLVDAMVKLHMQSDSIKWTVNGKTDETGTATIYTDGYFKGVPAGEYKVTVEKLETVIPPLPEVLPTNEEKLMQLHNQQEANTREYRLTDPIYCKVDSTPLLISVDKKKTEASFNVGKKYRELSY